MGDPHGQVIGVAGPVAALAALVVVATAPTPTVDRVDEKAAWSRLVHQVRLGPRPAGSPHRGSSPRQLRRQLPRGRSRAVPGGLRNVVGFVPGRDPSRTVVVGAHYDTKDLPGFVGANDGAGGTALVVQLARTVKPKQLRPRSSSSSSTARSRRTICGDFLETGLRGSKAAAPRYKNAEAMILLDFVADEISCCRARDSRIRRCGGGCGQPRGAWHDRRIPREIRHRRRGRPSPVPPPSACPRSTSSTSTTRAGIGRATTSRRCPSAVSTPWARPSTSSYGASSRPSTRARMSSRMMRTSSIGSPTGRGAPSRRNACREARGTRLAATHRHHDVRPLDVFLRDPAGNAAGRSMPSSRIASTTSGSSSAAGRDPAERASCPACFANASAICDRPALPTQTK